MLLVTINKSVCRRCLLSQSNIKTLRALLENRPFSTSYTLCNVRKAITKDVRSQPTGSFGQKAKEATRTTTYTAVVLVGVGVTGFVMYSIFKELLSSFSPQAVYSAAVEKCTAHPRVIDFLGDSVKSYGEESRRGRRQHISHLPYEVDGLKGFRIKFYLKGQRRTATAHLDAREISSGWEFRYLYVQLDSYPYEVIVIEDNRGKASEVELPGLSSNSLGELTPIVPSK